MASGRERPALKLGEAFPKPGDLGSEGMQVCLGFIGERLGIRECGVEAVSGSMHEGVV